MYQTARKKAISPKTNMKPLYWTRIQVPMTIPEGDTANKAGENSGDSPEDKSPVTNCLWEMIDEDKELVESQLINQFTDLFSRQPIVRKEKSNKQGKSKSAKDKKEVLKILDDRTAHKLNILITSLHLEISEIENAVYTFDTSVIGTETLMKIKDSLATEDEMALIKKHVESSGAGVLGKPEQFLYDLSQISCFSDRVTCIMFETTLNETISSMETKISNFLLTCDSLMTSRELADLFSIILTLGNYMNGGNRERGQADGFGLEILPKLKDVKGKAESRTPTLLHYIVSVYIDRYVQKYKITSFTDTEIPLPVPEPADLEKASLVDVTEIEKELVVFQEEIKSIERRVKRVVQAGSHVEPFKSRMATLVERANQLHQERKDSLNEVRKVLPRVMSFFKYRPKAVTESDQVKEFFGHWIPFCSDFKDIFKNEKAFRIREEVAAAKKKVKAVQVKKKETSKKETNKNEAKEGGFKQRMLRKLLAT